MSTAPTKGRVPSLPRILLCSTLFSRTNSVETPIPPYVDLPPSPPPLSLSISRAGLFFNTQTKADVPVCARQTVTVQYILELAKTLKRDPRECVNAFFARLATADPQYKAAFEDEVKALIARVQNRAHERLEEAETAAKKQRLGPGGLDPLEVLESLPEKIRTVGSLE